eukprot:CAMPEP_0114500902 /NCGR_PEP_ID=MMETSP0109-20121206/8213_1 /TAXON_ID=29199 /ORGANISM="Chlorarachnion reptans, Strain CCCM449" /LENGTH=511 /DNA_ID=CAMNT_0001678597 /DNA_START=63 /DNA_END=1594 /DNA_ORIENTATION=-
MSSLAAARADNFYHPPEWDPRKEGRNEYQARTGKGAARYTGHNQYAKFGKIRFEMPFNVWCNKCGHMIAKGVRFNAKKNRVGSYFSTTIWEFEMPCHQCFNLICVKTDPQNAEYLVTKGAKRKVEDYDAAKAGTVELLDLEEREARRADAMAHLEVAEDDKKRAKQNKGRMELLHDLADRMRDDYAVSSMLRKRFRKRKKELKKEESESRRPGIAIKILPETEDDRKEAALARYNLKRHCENDRAAKRFRIKASMFDPNSATSSTLGVRLARSGNISSTIEGALRRGLKAENLKLIEPQTLNQETTGHSSPSSALTVKVRKTKSKILRKDKSKWGKRAASDRLSPRSSMKMRKTWAKLIPVISVDTQQAAILLTKRYSLFGRCPGKDGIVIKSKYVSARHLFIERLEKGESSDCDKEPNARLFDISKYGTFITRGSDTVKTSKGCALNLHHGDLVTFPGRRGERSDKFTFRLLIREEESNSNNNSKLNSTQPPPLGEPFMRPPPKHFFSST